MSSKVKYWGSLQSLAMNCGVSSMSSARWNMPNSNLTFNMALEMLCLVCCTLNAIVSRIMVCVFHFPSSQCNVTVNYRSFATEGHMSNANKTSFCLQTYDIVYRMHFTTSSACSSNDLVTFLRLIRGHLGSTVLMKAVKSGGSSRFKSRLSHAHCFTIAHSLNRGPFGPHSLVYYWIESTALASLPTLDSFRDAPSLASSSVGILCMASKYLTGPIQRGPLWHLPLTFSFGHSV